MCSGLNKVAIGPPNKESPCKIKDFLLFCLLPQGVQNEHSYRVHSVDVNGLSFSPCSHRVDVNGLVDRVASLPVFDVNGSLARCERLAGFDVNGCPARCERFAGQAHYL